MNIPGFTAEVSFYKTSGHYRTDRNAITLPDRMTSVIAPAREVIFVHSCPPGFTMWAGPAGQIP